MNDTAAGLIAPQPLVPIGIGHLVVSHHERSHGIAFHSFGYKFTALELADDGTGCLVPLPGITRMEPRARAVILLAGAVGEGKFRGCSWEEVVEDAAASDLAMTREALDRLDNPPSLYSVASEADVILTTRWRSVQRVAFALADQRIITHADFIRLLAKW